VLYYNPRVPQNKKKKYPVCPEHQKAEKYWTENLGRQVKIWPLVSACCQGQQRVELLPSHLLYVFMLWYIDTEAAFPLSVRYKKTH
jgi:hypothetical protein